MNPWSLKKYGALFSLVIILVSFFSPYGIILSENAISFSQTTASAEGTPGIPSSSPDFIPVTATATYPGYFKGYPKTGYDSGPISKDSENDFHCDVTEKDCDDYIKNTTTMTEALATEATFAGAVSKALNWYDGATLIESFTQIDPVVTNSDATPPITAEIPGIAGQVYYNITEATGKLDLEIPISSLWPAQEFDEASLEFYWKEAGEPTSSYHYGGWLVADNEANILCPEGYVVSETYSGDETACEYVVAKLNGFNIKPSTTYEFALVGVYFYKNDGAAVNPWDFVFGILTSGAYLVYDLTEEALRHEPDDGNIHPFTFTVTTPADVVATGVEGGGTSGEEYKPPAYNGLNAWCLKFGEGKLVQLSVAGCVAELFQTALFPLFANLMYITGKFFDILANFTLGSEAYDESISFIQSGWVLIRDFSNILFIVALVYLAFGVIFDLHSVNVKKSIAAIVIMALMVNFSLFFTKIIIDTSNILARIFYTQIEVTGTEDAELTTSELDEVNISRGIVAGFDPQQIVSRDTQLKINQKMGNGYDANRLILIVYFMATVLVAVAAWTFFVTGFNFVQRTISLWLAMIFSPFAFVSLAFPFGLKGLKKIGWSSWLKDLLCWAFYAPLFFFFIYLIVSFAGSDFLPGFVEKASTYGIFEFIIFLIFPFIILMTLLIYAKNLAKSLGCDGADAFVSAGTKLAAGAAGVGMMVASAGGSALLSRTVGARANKELNSEKGTLLKAAAGGDARAMVKLRQMDSSYRNMKAADIQKSAEKKVKGLQKNASRSWDMRNTVGAQALSGALGINMNAGAGAAKWITKGGTGFSTAETAGGYKARTERNAQKQIEFIKSLGYDHHKAQELADKIKDGKDKAKELRKENETDRKAIEAKQKEKEGGEKNVKDANDALSALKAQKPSDYAGAEARKEYEQKIKAAEDAVKEAEKGAESINGDINTLNDNIKRRSGRMKDLNDQIAADREKKEKIEKGYIGSYARFMEYQAEAGPKTWGGQVSNSFPPFDRKNYKTWAKLIGQGVAGGLTGLAVLGPVGAAGGMFVGAVNGASKGGFLDALKNTLEVNQMQFNKDVAENLKSEADGHFHAGHYKDTYKPVMTGLAKFFENLAKGGIEIKGGGSHGGGGGHGGGHDDHGGGHGGGHH